MHKSCMTLTRISLSLPSSNLDITSPAIYSSAVEARNTQSSTFWLTKWSAKMSQPRYRHLYLVGLPYLPFIWAATSSNEIAAPTAGHNYLSLIRCSANSESYPNTANST